MKRLYLFFTLTLCISGEMLKAQSPMMVKNISSSGSSDPFSFAVMDDKLFFAANDGMNGIELWTSDGTSGGTKIVKSANISGDGIKSSKYNNMLVINSSLYTMMSNGAHGFELYKSDGTSLGTQIVKDVNIGSASQPDVKGNLVEFNGDVIFIGNDGVNGYELWRSDGTSEGTRMIKNLNINGNGITTTYLSQIPTVYKGFIYFEGTTDGTNISLFKTDGTSEGTTLIKAGLKDVYTFLEFNNELFFGGNDGTNGVELWKTDGTTEGTVMVKDIRTVGGTSSYPSILGIFNNSLLFNASDGIYGAELWKTDGTADGTVRISDISPTLSDPLKGITLGNKYIFPATPEGTTSTYKLYITDGTLEGTTLLKDVTINPMLFYHFLVDNEIAYFSANDGTSGYELWKTDGTTEGTVMVTDLNPGVAHSNPYNFIKLNGTIYFTADDGINGTELWSLGSPSTGIQSANENSKIQLFPNPVSQYLSIETSEIKDLESVEVFNLINQKVMALHVSAKSFQINTVELVSGTYLLVLKNKLGETYVRRFVKN